MPKNSSDKRWALAAIASIPLVMTLGNSMLIPVLPVIEKELGISAMQASMIISVYSIVAVVLIPWAGLLSDRVGRKAVILPSLCLAGLGGLASGLAPILFDKPYVWIIAGRFFQGIGASGAFPIVLPLVGDIFTENEEASRSLGIIETSNTLGKVLSPLIGAALAAWVWYVPFLSIPVLSLLSILMMLYFVQQPEKREQAPMTIDQFRKLLKKTFKREGRWLLSVFACGGIIMFILFGLLFYLSKTLEDRHGIDGIVKGLVLAIPLASLCFASFLGGRYIGKNQLLMKWTTFAGLLVLAAASFLMALFDSLYTVIGILVLGGAGIGVALPSLDALITETIEKQERGTITAVYSSMRFFGVATGPPVYSVLLGFSDTILFVLSGATALVSVVIALTGIRPTPTP